MYTEYMLSKWSRIVRIRDEHTCRMCLEEATSKRKMHSHHIKMKVYFPGEALDLHNGICLCADCHHRVVHGTKTNHKQFRVIFRRWNRRKAVKAFNNQWQHKLKYIGS